ncbi:LAQU0S02e10110g1_1 [Lachancea quebecensis]|uniref:LAQU0S02e10110g1_1 n=1 Tax=Lachancea quebecensis TaxID=1654605 RepID=A0A0P1KNA0_9SACH|nr:LAQU0S02e10110g1_1 [Lachancea quebecensis]
MEGKKKQHSKSEVECIDGSRRNSGLVPGAGKTLGVSDSLKNTKPPSWTSSISTITEELPAPRVSEAMTRVPSAASAISYPYCSSVPEEPDVKPCPTRARWWNTLPKIGETVHSHKHSLNVVVLNVNGTPREIIYDPRYNPFFSKLEIFYMFNAQTPLSDCYTHAKTRLESFVKFLDVYHSSRQYASACLPFNVSVAANATSGGYPSYTAGIDYREIGEIVQLWYLQSLKFMLDNNSFLFSNEIVDYLVNYEPHKNANIKKELSGSGSPLSALQETISRADILLIRCTFEEELGWQLALDEPNWNIVDLFVDLSFLGKLTTENEREESSGNATSVTVDADGDTTLSPPSSVTSSPSTSATTSSSDISYGKVSESIMREPVRSGNDIFVDPQTEVPNSSCAKACHVIVQDCVGRDLDKLATEMRARSLSESRRPSISQNSSEESISSQKQSQTSKKDQPAKSLKGSTGLGISNFFRRKNSHASGDKGDNPLSSKRAPQSDSIKMNLTIQNSYLDDYYASTLANFRKLVLPSHCMFSRRGTPKSSKRDSATSKKQEAKSYQKEFLQVKLPLKDESIPVIVCPDVWFSLEFKKWKGLINELFRCIRPGGFLETSACNLTNVNDCYDLEKSSKEFPTLVEMKALTDAISMEAVKAGLQVFPMRHLVGALKAAGFVNIKHTVLSLKRGDLRHNMGFLFEFLAIRNYDYQLRNDLLSSDIKPPGTNPASFPLRYIEEHMGKADEDAGVVRIVLITAQKP